MRFIPCFVLFIGIITYLFVVVAVNKCTLEIRSENGLLVLGYDYETNYLCFKFYSKKELDYFEKKIW